MIHVLIFSKEPKLFPFDRLGDQNLNAIAIFHLLGIFIDVFDTMSLILENLLLSDLLLANLANSLAASSFNSSICD